MASVSNPAVSGNYEKLFEDYQASATGGSLIYTFATVADSLRVNPLEPPFRLVIDAPDGNGPHRTVDVTAAQPSMHESEAAVVLRYDVTAGDETHLARGSVTLTGSRYCSR